MLYSQLDPQWKSDLLGFSKSSTIGGYGCTITCIAMFAGLAPDIVNQRLKAVNGFQDSLVVWSKVQEAIPWIRCVGRFTTYDNEAVRQAILENGACLVEVDFDSKIETLKDTHWVLYTGNQLMSDPWGGTQRSTSYYARRLGYAVFANVGQKETYMKYKGLDLSNTDSMKAAIDIWDAVVNQKTYLKADDAKSATEKALSDQATALKTAQSTAEAKEAFIDQIAEKVGSTDDQSDIIGHIEGLLQVEDHLDTANKVIDRMKEENEKANADLKAQIDAYQKRISELEQDVINLKKTGEDIKQQAENNATQETQISLFQNIVTRLKKLFIKY